ncbi:MAG: response regulator [Candidatus Methylacidiphilales bacterium]|nr:response regulator [Candidatus Methylacidiphilales bacterium]
MEHARILIADDQEGVRTILRMALSRRPVEVDEACDGRDALAHCLSGSYDLLLLDLRMPFLGGLEFLEQARAQHIDTPVLVISGHLDARDLPRAFGLGVVDFLSKPFEIGRMLETVDDLLLRQHELRQDIDWRVLANGPLLRRARALVQGRRWEEAEEVLSVILEREPGHSEALVLEGLIAEVGGRFGQAEADYKKACLTERHRGESSRCEWLHAG